MKNELQEVSKSNGTNAYINDTDISDTDLSFIPLEYDKIELEWSIKNLDTNYLNDGDDGSLDIDGNELKETSKKIRFNPKVDKDAFT